MGFYLCWLFIIMFCQFQYYLLYIMFIILLILVPMVPMVPFQFGTNDTKIFFHHGINDTKRDVITSILFYLNDDVIYCVFGTILYNLYNKKPKPLQPPLGNAAREIAQRQRSNLTSASATRRWLQHQHEVAKKRIGKLGDNFQSASQ